MFQLRYPPEKSRFQTEFTLDSINSSKEVDPSAGTGEFEADIDQLVYNMHELTDEEEVG